MTRSSREATTFWSIFYIIDKKKKTYFESLFRLESIFPIRGAIRSFIMLGSRDKAEDAKRWYWH
jgi:hypothetical protein